MSSLDCLTERNLRTLAGDRWFARGQAYQQEGRVADLTTHDDSVTAVVAGTQTYRVRLSCKNSRIAYVCTCPVGDEGNFCKHCVAVGLAWLGQQTSQTGFGVTKSKGLLRRFLENLDQQQLVNLILDEASRNRRLRDRLELDAARSRPNGVDLSLFKKAITRATRTQDVDYHSMPGFAQRVCEVIESIRRLLDDGHAMAVVDLTEYACKRLETALGEVDDSDGHFGVIVPELEELHHAACLLAREDPEALARRLFNWELNGEWDFFSRAAAIYADVLGEKGLLEYRRLAEARWSQFRALQPGDSRTEREEGRYRITSIMETLARESGDPEALIEVKKRDLSHSFSFLQIAEIYREAKRYDAALEWAEKGASSFRPIDPRISDFLATEYHRRGRHAEAMSLIWERFVQRPGLEMYQHLRAHALQVKSPRNNLRLVGPEERNGNKLSPTAYDVSGEPTHEHGENTSEWARWREQALQHIHEGLERQKESQPSYSGEKIKLSSPWREPGDRSLLVEIFLWEKKVEEAWREAIDGACTGYLWLQLADAVAKDHPERAYVVYKDLIEPTIAPTNNNAYSEAIKLLTKMRKLAVRLNREVEFDDYLIALRVEYKRKRNFIKLLDVMRRLN